MIFVQKANIPRRDVRDASHVLQARFQKQPVEIAAHVGQVVFPKMCQLVSPVLGEHLLLGAVPNARHAVQGSTLESKARVARIALTEPFPILKGLQSVLDVPQEAKNSIGRLAKIALLERFRLVETAHVSNAQLAKWRQSKVAAHVISVQKANILRRPMQSVLIVIQAQLQVQPVETAVGVLQAVFPRA